METPFEIRVYTKFFQRQGFVSNPVAATFTPRFNAQGSGELRLKRTERALEWLLQPGARVVVHYLGEHLMSGRVLKPRGDFLESGDVTLQVSDDWRRVRNTLAWVRPTQPLMPTQRTSQTAPGGLGQAWIVGGDAYAGPGGELEGQSGFLWWPDGSAAWGTVNVPWAESAVKFLLQQNLVTRTAQPITVAPDLGRGGSSSLYTLPDIRFCTVEEGVQPILGWEGLGLSFAQEMDGTTIVADCYTPKVWAAPFDSESGVVTGGSWSIDEGGVTRAVSGGPGEEAGRAFGSAVNASLEAEYGEVIEVFRDATGARMRWPKTLDEDSRVAKYYPLITTINSNYRAAFLRDLQVAADKALLDSPPTAGVNVTLSETKGFRYGGTNGYHVGDTMTVKSGQLEFTDHITEATLSINADEGFRVRPLLGERKDDPDRQLVRSLQKLAASVRRSNSNK